MDRTFSQTFNPTSLSLSKLCFLAILLCPTATIAAGLIHPLRVWAAGGEWCQVVAPGGQSQVIYGGRCEGSLVGLVRRFN